MSILACHIYIAKENLRWLIWKLWDPVCSEIHIFCCVVPELHSLVETNQILLSRQQGMKYGTVSTLLSPVVLCLQAVFCMIHSMS